MTSGGKGLLEYISENPTQVLGPEVFSRFGPDLPFLFKVRIRGSYCARHSIKSETARIEFKFLYAWSTHTLRQVLSVAKALSIQAHPDKALAQRLHASRPDMCAGHCVTTHRRQPRSSKHFLSLTVIRIIRTQIQGWKSQARDGGRAL